jgi:hypothetical protein
MTAMEELTLRVDALELRVIALALASGHPELAIPFPSPAQLSERLTRSRFDEAMSSLTDLVRSVIQRQDAHANMLGDFHAEVTGLRNEH